MKHVIFGTCFFLLTARVFSQTPILNAVKIEFEKTVYVHQQYKEFYADWYSGNRDLLPEIAISYFDFIGDTTKSLYKPGKQNIVNTRTIYQSVADKNVIFSDYTSNRKVSQKQVFEETFLIEDSLSNIKWKITADIREIAGFKCRKAVGILNDTIGVFAFYTEQILISGGPESVCGLPGMILGMGIPRLHITWFAKSIKADGLDLSVIKPPTQGTKVDTHTMLETVNRVLKSMGRLQLILNFVI